jgi:hypothetical protein
VEVFHRLQPASGKRIKYIGQVEKAFFGLAAWKTKHPSGSERAGTDWYLSSVGARFNNVFGALPLA